MRSLSFLAAIAIAAFCMGDLMAQCSSCGTNYAAPAVPMMTSYASVGCNGCYQTSMAPSVSYGGGCSSCSQAQPAMYTSSGCSSCGVSAPISAPVVSSYQQPYQVGGCSSCGVSAPMSAPVVANYQPMSMPMQSFGCSSCGTSMPVSAPIANYQPMSMPMQSFGCASCGTSMPSYDTVGSIAPQTYSSSPISYGTGCSSCGDMNYGTYTADASYAPSYGTSYGGTSFDTSYGSSCGGCCGGCNGGMVMDYGVSSGCQGCGSGIIQGGCSDCVGGSVPYAEGQIIEGNPVPTEVQGEVTTPSEEKVDTPPTPEDA